MCRLGRLNAEYEKEQDRQEQKRHDDVKAREAKSRRAYEVLFFCIYFIFATAVTPGVTAAAAIMLFCTYPPNTHAA